MPVDLVALFLTHAVPPAVVGTALGIRSSKVNPLAEGEVDHRVPSACGLSVSVVLPGRDYIAR